MKTLSFQVHPEKKQRQTIDRWTNTLRHVWNQGLEVLLELDTYTSSYKVPVYKRFIAVMLLLGMRPDWALWFSLKLGNKRGQEFWLRAPCCPVPWTYRWLKGKRWNYVGNTPTIVDGDEDKDWAAVPYTPFANKRPYRRFCPVIRPSVELYSVEETPIVQRWLRDEGIEAVTFQPKRLGSKAQSQAQLAVAETALPNASIYFYPASDQPFELAYREPRLDFPTNFSLAKYFAQKRHPDWKALQDIPAWFVRGTCHSLAEAWQRYKARKNGQPKFKRKGDTVATLLYEDGKAIKVEVVDELAQKWEKADGKSPKKAGKVAKKQISVRTTYITVPKLGRLRVPYATERWGNTPIKVLKLCVTADGCFLQLTGNVPTKKPKATGHKAGCVFPQSQGILCVDDVGKMVEATPEDLKVLRRIEQLQQKMAVQRTALEGLREKLMERILAETDSAKKAAMQAKLSNLGQRLKKTKKTIAKLHQRQALRARNHAHKITTYQIRKFDAIAIQEVKAGTIPHPEPVVTNVEPAHYAPNGATEVAQINQRRTMFRTGQFVALLKQKGKDAGRTITVVKTKKVDKSVNPATIATSIRP